MKKAGKIIALSILTIFAISIFAGVISAAWNVKDTFIETFGNILEFNSFKDFFKNVLSPEILFGLLIFLIIFAIIEKMPLFGGSSWIKVTISIVLAFLAGGFIDTSVLLPILNQYTALGITISFLLPFVLIFYFLKEIAPQNRLLQKTVWIVYAIVIFLNAFVNWDRLENPTITKAMYWLVIMAAVVMAFMSAWIMNKLFVENLKSQIGGGTEEIEASLAAQILQDEDKLSQLSGAAKTAIERRIARNKATLNRLRA